MNDVGQGRSNTVPLQSSLKISETVTHVPSEAHHAHSSSSAHVVQSGYSLHRGTSEGGAPTAREKRVQRLHTGGHFSIPIQLS